MTPGKRWANPKLTFDRMGSNGSIGTGNESGAECIYRMSGGPGEPERIGSVIRDANGRVLDPGSDTNPTTNQPMPKKKNITPRGLLKIQPGKYQQELKFNKPATNQPNMMVTPEANKQRMVVTPEVT